MGGGEENQTYGSCVAGGGLSVIWPGNTPECGCGVAPSEGINITVRSSSNLGAEAIWLPGDCRQSFRRDHDRLGSRILTPGAGSASALSSHLPRSLPLHFDTMRYAQLFVLLLLPFLAATQVRNSSQEFYVRFSLPPLFLPPSQHPTGLQRQGKTPTLAARRHPIAAVVAQHNRLQVGTPLRPPLLP